MKRSCVCAWLLSGLILWTGAVWSGGEDKAVKAPKKDDKKPAAGKFGCVEEDKFSMADLVTFVSS